MIDHLDEDFALLHGSSKKSAPFSPIIRDDWHQFVGYYLLSVEAPVRTIMHGRRAQGHRYRRVVADASTTIGEEHIGDGVFSDLLQELTGLHPRFHYIYNQSRFGSIYC